MPTSGIEEIGFEYPSPSLSLSSLPPLSSSLLFCFVLTSATNPKMDEYDYYDPRRVYYIKCDNCLIPGKKHKVPSSPLLLTSSTPLPSSLPLAPRLLAFPLSSLITLTFASQKVFVVSSSQVKKLKVCKPCINFLIIIHNIFHFKAHI
jgi:hypothetical protein